jgi:hypothetical protein
VEGRFALALLGAVALCAALMAWNIKETASLKEVIVERRLELSGQRVSTKVTLSDGQTVEVVTERYLAEEMDDWRKRHDDAVFRAKER